MPSMSRFFGHLFGRLFHRPKPATSTTSAQQPMDYATAEAELDRLRQARQAVLQTESDLMNAKLKRCDRYNRHNKALSDIASAWNLLFLGAWGFEVFALYVYQVNLPLLFEVDLLIVSWAFAVYAVVVFGYRLAFRWRLRRMYKRFDALERQYIDLLVQSNECYRAMNHSNILRYS